VQPTTSLLISTYNWPEALELVFESILVQTVLPDEIIIADDGSKKETTLLIDAFKKRVNTVVKHIWQPDDGFRKTIIMNKAIRSSESDYIIQIDGDIILHPDFIKDHLLEAKKGYFIKGSRGLLNHSLTKKLMQSKNVLIGIFSKGLGSRINSTRLPMLTPLFYGSTDKTSDLRGCNFGFWKDDFVAVNGYNNDLVGWGHEDIELAARLVNSGVKRKQLKMMAVCYHLNHQINSRDQEDKNYEVYLDVIKQKIKRCENGYRESL
jgi:glycosyltransferase involved in cell wall biosynthesis